MIATCTRPHYSRLPAQLNSTLHFTFDVFYIFQASLNHRANVKKIGFRCGCGVARPGKDDKRTKVFRTLPKFRNRVVNGYVPNSRPWLAMIQVTKQAWGQSYKSILQRKA
jgi:hypothetical protein